VGIGMERHCSEYAQVNVTYVILLRVEQAKARPRCYACVSRSNLSLLAFCNCNCGANLIVPD
jgi:hypothetical protein